MKLLKIKDNSKIRKEDFSSIAGITHKIADKTLEQLDKEGIFVFPNMIYDAEDITKDQIILQSNHGFYHSGNVMGFIGYGDERLIIASRFYSANNDYFFQYLLQKVLDFPNIVDLETDVNADERLFGLLIFLFPYYLKNAMRKGIFKTYIHKEYNDCNIKGTIDIARHITKNTPFIGSIAYHQREHSYDNYLMELIRHTIEFIQKKPYGSSLLMKVKEEVRLIVNVTQNYRLCDKQKLIADNKRNIIRHAYYQEYRILQQLCLLILQYQKHQIGFGTRQIYGILFDGAWLWEEYINLLVKDIFYHPMNKCRKDAQRLFDGNIGRIYPDFISRNNHKRMIADAKYKPADRIGNRDYLQILAYMFRFDAKQGFSFYPEAQNTGICHLRLNQGSTYENNVQARNDVCVIKHGLKIPSNIESYSDFVKNIESSEQIFRETLISFMNENTEK